MRNLLFGKGLLGPTLNGVKKITLRRYRAETHSFVQGEVVRGIFLDGMDLLIRITEDTKTCPFSELADDVAQEDGYADAESAFEGLINFYPDLQSSDLAATIRFEIYSVEGIPAVRINEHA